MKKQLTSIQNRATRDISAAASVAEIEELRVKFLGKKGDLTNILKTMGKLSEEERPAMGKMANETRELIEALISARIAEVSERALKEQLAREVIDVTLPGVKPVVGRRHPLNTVLDEAVEVFLGMGFDVAEGPEIELARYNFDMLNTPEGHPARDPQDTFYINDSVVLRTQTSTVQVRTMLNQKPPIRVIAPGRVYRCDTPDATHSPVFHQIEGLVVDWGITMADLKGTLDAFAKKLYGKDIKTRFRPHHFPFTEPSAEMDGTCFKCKGKGCALCKGEGYIELLGCGMVHPNVLKACGIDPTVYSGFAFGMGLDRLTMMRYGIDDVRLLFENDFRFLSQF